MRKSFYLNRLGDLESSRDSRGRPGRNALARDESTRRLCDQTIANEDIEFGERSHPFDPDRAAA
jgi:hypothetical protein